MRFLTALFVCLMAVPAMANAAGIEIERASTLEMPAAMPTAGIFLIITNDGPADKLVGVKAGDLGKPMLHTSDINEQGIMQMREQKSLDVPADGKLVMVPGGPHVMLTDVKKQFKKGETFSLTLTFEKAGDKQITVDVVAPDTLTKRFPPELSSDIMTKMKEAREKAGLKTEKKSTLDAMREKIQRFFRKDEVKPEMDPSKLPTREEMEARSAMDPVPMGLSSTPAPQETAPAPEASAPMAPPAAPATAPAEATVPAAAAPAVAPAPAPAPVPTAPVAPAAPADAGAK